MAKSSQGTDTTILELTHEVVRGLLSLNAKDYGEASITQCKNIAANIGTMLAPQLYGARIHGVGNAISIVIRSCAEALFWLHFSDKPDEKVIADVEKLMALLSSPSL